MDVNGGVKNNQYYTASHPEGHIVIVDSSLSYYWDSAVLAINSSGKYNFTLPMSNDRTMGQGTYTLIADIVSSFDPMLPASIALVVSTTILGPSGEKRDLHEIYNYCKNRDTPKGSAKRLLSFLGDFTWNPLGPRYTNVNNRLIPYAEVPEANRVQADNSYIWLGVVENEAALLQKVYIPSGFYFPCVFPNVSSLESVTPRNLTVPFRFYSGYRSREIDGYLNSNWAKGVQLSLERNEVIEIIGEHPSENFGALSSTDQEVAGIFSGSGETLSRNRSPGLSFGGHGTCAVSFPSIPADLLRDITTRLFSFHTHPFSCHRKTGLLLGFPSEQDYATASGRQVHKVDEGSFVFTREGVFIIQYHPFVKYCISKGTVTPQMMEGVEVLFQQYLAAIQYGASRRGATTALHNLSQKIQVSPLSASEIQYVYSFDDVSIDNLLRKTTSFLQKYAGIMNVPPIFVQCIQRKEYSEGRQPKFWAPNAYLHNPNTWA